MLSFALLRFALLMRGLLIGVLLVELVAPLGVAVDEIGRGFDGLQQHDHCIDVILNGRRLLSLQLLHHRIVVTEEIDVGDRLFVVEHSKGREVLFQRVVGEFGAGSFDH